MTTASSQSSKHAGSCPFDLAITGCEPSTLRTWYRTRALTVGPLTPRQQPVQPHPPQKVEPCAPLDMKGARVTADWFPSYLCALRASMANLSCLSRNPAGAVPALRGNPMERRSREITLPSVVTWLILEEGPPTWRRNAYMHRGSKGVVSS